VGPSGAQSLTDEEQRLLLEMAAAAKPLLVTEATNRVIGGSFEGGDRLKGAYSDLWSSLDALWRQKYSERTGSGSTSRHRLTSLGKQEAAALTLTMEKTRAGKHGPEPDLATGKRVENIIKQEFPDGGWGREENRPKLRQLLQNSIEIPPKWKPQRITWLTAEWGLVRSVINNHLKNEARINLNLPVRRPASEYAARRSVCAQADSFPAFGF
jgi:hypothetical protein